MQPEPYSVVYLDTALTLAALTSWLEGLLGAPASLGSVVNHLMCVHCATNKEHDPALADDAGEDGFLYYRFILDISPAAGASEPAFFAAVDELLQALAQPGVRFVTAAEDEPARWRGGRWDGRAP